jgi:hypothetical protein
MTPRQMEDKFRQYEYALHEIVQTLWDHAVIEQDRRHAAGEMANPESQSLQISLANIALQALHKPAAPLM